ncbi:MAG: hypothetical protein FJY19_01330 [Bacteroidetes bacterium]|nr:hypothetical protein [Bacteroidota bacterium]
MINKKGLFTIALSFFVFTSSSYGQYFVGKSASWCKENRSLSALSPALVYDKENICIREMYWREKMDDCEKIVSQLTSVASYGWIRINENQWVSKFEDQLLVEIHEVNKGCRTQVHRTAWTKELYELLLKNE